jgi:hypothetical protein
MVDDSLFWSADNATPFGPNLEVLEVIFHQARPDGKWYFEGPGGEGHEALGYRVTKVCYPTFELADIDMDMDELQARRPCGCDECSNCQFRISPNDTNIRHLLEGFAKAATQMRFFRKALLWSPMRWYRDEDDDPSFLEYDFEEYDDLVWGMGYESGEGVSCRELNWVVSQWRPDPELHDVFQQTGRTQHGNELKELWTEDLFENSPGYAFWCHYFMFRNDAGRIFDSC